MRFTHLLLVSCCIALLCAALTNAATASSVAAAGDAEWEPLSISVEVGTGSGNNMPCGLMNNNKAALDFYGEESVCGRGDYRSIDSYVVPLTSVASTLGKLLSVQRKPLSIPAYDKDSPCARFGLPASNVYRTDANFVLYYTARPSGPNSNGLLSVVCSWDEVTGRPTSGVVNIAGQFPLEIDRAVKLLKPELLRMLGFNTTVFANKNMVTRATVRGVENVPLVNSPMVLQMARDFYGCRTLPGMELDYDSTNDNGPLPYWRGRVAKDDVMSSAGNMTYVTPMTLAAMEDTGFYKGNYANADLMPWGYKAGCDFVTRKCVEGGKSNFGNLFCTDGLSSPPVSHCTSDHLAIGRCGMGKASGDLPSPFQYFADAAEGGSLSTMDYCPVVQADVSDMCLGGNGYAVSFYHDLLRCIDTKDTGASSGGSAACLPVTCNYTDRTFLISTTRARLLNVPCPAGEVLNVSNIKDKGMFKQGFIYCPQFEEVCPVRYPYTANVPDHTSSTGTETSSAADLLHPSRWHDRMLNGVIWSCVLIALVAYAVLHSCLCKVSPFVYPM